MNWLQTHYAHVAGYVRSMTPGSRAVAGLLLLVIVASAVYLHVCPLTVATESLLGEQALAPDELGRIQLALADAGMSCDVAESRALIPRGRRAEYMAALRRAGALPSGRLDAMDKALESDTLLTPPEQRKAKYNRARAKTLEAEIAAFAGVADARVTLDSVEQRRLGRGETLHAASVVVTMKPDERLTTKLGAMICNHVAGSVAGMHPADVTVSDNVNLIPYRGVRDDQHSFEADPLANREVLEQEYQAKIRGLLRDFLPDAQVVVRIQPVRSFSGDAARAAGFSATERRVNRENLGGFDEQEIGRTPTAMTANQPRELPGAQESDADDCRSDWVADAGPPSMLPRVVIRVPQRYFRRLWDEQSEAANDPSERSVASFRQEEIEARAVRHIQQLAVSALPPVEGIADPAELVTVIALPEAMRLADDRRLEAAIPSFCSAKQTIGLVVLGLAAAGYLVVRLRGARRKSRSDSSYRVTHARFSTRAAAEAHDDLNGIELDSRLARRLVDRQGLISDEAATIASTRGEPEVDDVFFDAMTRLDAATLIDLGEAAGPELLALAAVGAPSEITDRILAGASPALAASIRRTMSHFGPTRLSDVDAARRRLLELMASADDEADSSREDAVAMGESIR